MEKNRKIQGLRGLAFILIFLSHTQFCKNADGGNFFRWAGAFGVEIFICLTGYLFYRYKAATWGGFTVEYLFKKIKKFYPLHLLTLLVAVPISKPYNGSFVIKLFLNCALLQSCIPLQDYYFSLNMVAWYLSTYIFLLLLLPVVKWVLDRITHISKVILLIFLIVFAEAGLLVLAMHIPVDTHWFVYIFPLTRSLDLLLGGCAAKILILFEKMNASKNRKLRAAHCSHIGWTISIILIWCSNYSFKNEIWSTLSWAIPTLLILLGIGESSNNNLYNSRGLVFLGNISMELFLFHHLINRYFNLCAEKYGLEKNILAYVVCFLIAVAFAVTFGKWRQMLVGKSVRNCE